MNRPEQMRIGHRLKIASGHAMPRGYALWLAVSLCLMLAMSLWSQAYSHGPGALIEGQRLVAEATAHGHSHDPADHNATDHDHQTAEIAWAADTAHTGRFPPPATAPVAGNLPDGIARDGLRRPPRSVVA